MVHTLSVGQVWVIAQTGEVFLDYEKYLNRYVFTAETGGDVANVNGRRDFYLQARAPPRAPSPHAVPTDSSLTYS